MLLLALSVLKIQRFFDTEDCGAYLSLFFSWMRIKLFEASHCWYFRNLFRTVFCNQSDKTGGLVSDNYWRMTSRVPKICTHNGTFHCDEILACYMLRLLPEYKDAEIIRSRDASVIDDCDVVVDVGAVFDHSKHHYDHHQREFSETMSSLSNGKYKWKTKLSSAGLVYYHFGYKVLSILMESDDQAKVTAVYKKVYENFIEEVDGIDNGVPLFSDEPKYKICTHLSARVSRLNVRWNSSDNNTEKFYEAFHMVGQEFKEHVNHWSQVWWPAYEIVCKAVMDRYETHSSGEIICLPNGGCPWKEHLFELEEKLQIKPTIKFVLFEDQSGGWRVSCVPIAPQSFICRQFLAEAWRGLRDEELSVKSAIEGCIFVHANGFIGGNKTYSGALEMAVKSLNV